ncbi:MAG: hypothetical protein U0441_14135 [Polyangiaceae bacterium]
MTMPSSTTDGLRSSFIVRGIRGAMLMAAALGLYACVAPVESNDSQDDLSSENVGEAEQALCSVFTGGCRAAQTCCSGVCTSTANDPQNCGGCGVVCGANEVCSGSQCVCAAGYTDCNGSCKNLLTDRYNCGSCGHACHISPPEYYTNWCEDGGCYFP